MRVVCFKLDEELVELLEMYAEKRDTTKSELIRRAIDRYMQSLTGNDKPFITKRIRIYP